MALARWRVLPDSVRIDLPSPRAFARVLGVYRTGATLKKRPLRRLELSVREISELAGYSQTTTAAVLRWLGCESLEYGGARVAAGLGVIHRGRRTAWGYLRGARQRLYRTSRSVLTAIGAALLGLKRTITDDKHRRPRELTPMLTPPAPPPRSEATHIEGQGSAGGGDDPYQTTDYGRTQAARIRNNLN